MVSAARSTPDCLVVRPVATIALATCLYGKFSQLLFFMTVVKGLEPPLTRSMPHRSKHGLEIDIADLDAGRLGPVLLFHFAAKRVAYQQPTQVWQTAGLSECVSCGITVVSGTDSRLRLAHYTRAHGNMLIRKQRSEWWVSSAVSLCVLTHFRDHVPMSCRLRNRRLRSVSQHCIAPFPEHRCQRLTRSGVSQEVELESFATRYVGQAIGGGDRWRGKLSAETDSRGQKVYRATRKVVVPPGLAFYSVYRSVLFLEGTVPAASCPLSPGGCCARPPPMQTVMLLLAVPKLGLRCSQMTMASCARVCDAFLSLLAIMPAACRDSLRS